MLNPASAPSEMTAPSHTKLYNEDEMTVNDLLHISSTHTPSSLLSVCSSLSSCKIRIRFVYLSTQGHVHGNLIKHSELPNCFSFCHTAFKTNSTQYGVVWLSVAYERDLECFKVFFSGIVYAEIMVLMKLELVYLTKYVTQIP